ncbi:hypothetical protein [Rubellimicrobium mesophilum]|nr:hypothetical protein [Rubellimicrobium mesophilum]
MEDADRRPLGVTAFFAEMGERFVDGRLEEMASVWSFPCPIEMDGQLVVMHDPGLFRDYLADRRAAALASGMTAMTPRISAIEMPSRSRFRVWLRWLYHFGGHVEEANHGTVYFMAVAPDGCLRIEMMDLVQLPSDQSAARIA